MVYEIKIRKYTVLSFRYLVATAVIKKTTSSVPVEPI